MITTLFIDVGGVCLTNGWDSTARRAAMAHFALDGVEFERRHATAVDPFERGEMSLDAYLDYTVFHTPRDFSRDAFVRFMEAQSQPHDDVLSLIRRIAAARVRTVATINNESRELNRYRIDTFHLRDLFAAFFSSCYVRVRKPDRRIYEIALDVMEAEPSRCLFVDDREENVASARALGMHTIHVTYRHDLPRQLIEAGIDEAAP